MWNENELMTMIELFGWIQICSRFFPPPQEMVIDVDPRTRAAVPRYLIYDAIVVNGKDVKHHLFNLRWQRVMVGISSKALGFFTVGQSVRRKKT